MPPVSLEQDLAMQSQLLRALLSASLHDAAGVSLSFLLHCAHNHPHVLRRLLNEPVVKEGFRGTSMLTVLTRVAKS